VNIPKWLRKPDKATPEENTKNTPKQQYSYQCPVCSVHFPNEYAMLVHEKQETRGKWESMAKYYKDPVTGKAYNDPELTRERKTMYPATEMQRERISEMKDRLSGEDLDWLLDMIRNTKMLDTRGGAGKLINEMKTRIRAAGGEID
jgi:hypothetical protein